jgi:hypothetical protein
MNRTSKLRIVFLGYMVRGPLGGLSWHYLHYLLGLLDLGHDVFYMEDSDDYVSCYDPRLQEMTTDPSYGLRYLRQAFTRLGLGDAFAYYDAHTGIWHGRTRDEAHELLRSADLLIDLSGVNPMRPWFEHIPVRVLIDTDPVFTQIRNLTDPAKRAQTDRHTAWFTFGESIGSSASTVPDDGIPWRPTRQPIHLRSWPMCEPAPGRTYTTVMQWESYPALEFGGERYGLKKESFQEFLDMPARVPVRMQLALGGNDPRPMLKANGWSVVNPLRVTRNPWTFQHYLWSSRGEWTVAKQAYVQTSSGWFSERSANYLASGRPVVTQETGFSQYIPTGDGLFSFSTMDEAVAAIETIESDYERHRAAAREIAVEFFDATKVLSALLDAVYAAT